MTTEPTTVTDEIAAMRRIVGALEKLDPDSRSRVVAWVADRYRYDLDLPDLIRGQEGSFDPAAGAS